MFKSMIQVIKEQFEYRSLIFRLASFDVKGSHQIHYLGSMWQFINPLIQIGIYWFVFGIGLRGGQPVGDLPFFLWLLMGLIPWFFISPSLLQGSSSVYQQVSLVSKMNFPVSILPTVKLMSKSFQFLIMMGLLIIVLFIYGLKPTWHYLQLPYYFIALYVFLFAFSILSSTISTVVRDFQLLLQSTMRMLLYLTPILWDTSKIPELYENILRLNPFFYIIEGFRNTFTGEAWFFENITYTIYFWILTFVILYFGANIHMKLRKNFVDYL